MYRKILLFSMFILGIVLILNQIKSSDNWTIDGDTVYIDDSNVYISATPHTITHSQWVYFNIMSKKYEGDIDVVFGFDTEVTKPTLAEFYSPHEVDDTHSYTCHDYFNYTLSPKHAWCWRNVTDYIANTSTEIGWHYELIGSHDFEWGSLADKTIYWNVSRTEDYIDVSDKFENINYDYGGMNKWYYIKDFTIEKNKEYLLRGWVSVPVQLGSISGKYWVAVKPSGETISEAISLGHLYYLDPWWDSSYGYRYEIYSNITTPGMPISVNDTGDGTGGVGTISVWTNNATEMYLYCEASGCTSGDVAVASLTTELNWENESSSTGNSVEDIWHNCSAVYHFHEAHANDSSSNDYEEIGIFGNPSTAPGVFGNAIEFDGVDDIINITHVGLGESIGPNYNWTISLWLNSSDYCREASVKALTLRNSTAMELKLCHDSDDRIIIYVSDSSSWETILLEDNPVADQWYYIVFTYDEASKDVLGYLNGTYIATDNVASLDVGTTNLFIGAGDSNVEEMVGTIDELRFWNRTLTAQEIKENWYNGQDNLTALGTEEINLTTIEINLTLDDSDSNSIISYGDIVNITAEINVTGLFVELYQNGTLINNGTTRVENITTDSWFINSTYNITAEYPGNSTYGHASSTLYIKVMAEGVAVNLYLNESWGNFGYVKTIDTTKNVYNIDNNGTHLWVANGTSSITRYLIDGTFESDWVFNRTNCTGSLRGIAVNDTHYFTVTTNPAQLCYYDINESINITLKNISLHVSNVLSTGIDAYDGKLYVSDRGTPGRVFIYHMNGTYDSVIDVSDEMGNGKPSGIAVTNDYIFLGNDMYAGTIDNVYVFDLDGTLETSFNASQTNGNATNGLTGNSTHLWVVNAMLTSGDLWLHTNITKIKENKTITYGNAINITANVNKTGEYVELYRNGTMINNGTDDIDIMTNISSFANSTYNITAEYPGNENYTSASETLYVKVLDADSILVLTVTPTTPTIYETQNNVTCYAEESENSTYVYRNGTDISSLNNTNVYTGVGGWNYTCNISSYNYTTNETFSIYTITKKNVSVKVYPTTQTIGSGTNATQFCTDNSTLLSCSVYRDNSLVTNNTNATLATGTYSYIANITDTANYTSWNDTSTLTVIGITNCSTGGTRIYNFTFYDEKNFSTIVTNFDVTFNISLTTTRSETAFSFTGQNNYSICVYPQLEENVTVDAQMDYWADGYEHKSYYYVDAIVANTSFVNQSLYLLSEADSDKITFTIKDAEGSLEEDMYVKVQRYYVGTNTYRTVAIGKSDYLGQFITYLEMYDVWYKFILEQNGTVMQVISPMKIASTDITLMVTATGQLEWFKYYDKIAYSCAYSNITENLVCTATDTSGYINTFCLNVTEIFPQNTTVLCESCDASSSVTLTCSIGNATGRTIHYILSAKTTFNPTDWITIVSDTLEEGVALSVIFGLSGVLIALLITGTSSFMGLWRPEIGIVLLVAGLVISSLFGFMPLMLSSIVGMALVGGIIIYRLRK